MAGPTPGATIIPPPMATTGTEPLLRLLQLVSPSLPVGAYAYSQGLEWAVEAGWVTDAESLEGWVEDLLHGSLARLDLPLLARLYRACVDADEAAMAKWSGGLLAARESAELRAEERARGRALANLLADLGLARATAWRAHLARCQAAGFACAAVAWDIDRREALAGYAWGWLENQVLAGVKLIPLGQTAGQRALQRLAPGLARAVEVGLALEDDELGACHPALAIASSLHETQYTRLFRS